MIHWTILSNLSLPLPLITTTTTIGCAVITQSSMHQGHWLGKWTDPLCNGEAAPLCLYHPLRENAQYQLQCVRLPSPACSMFTTSGKGWAVSQLAAGSFACALPLLMNYSQGQQWRSTPANHVLIMWSCYWPMGALDSWLRETVSIFTHSLTHTHTNQNKYTPSIHTKCK